MTYRKLWVCCFGVVLAGGPLACMDLDGYYLKSEVAARGGGGGGPATGSGGTVGAPRGGSGGNGTCEEEVFTLYNNAADYEEASSSCTGSYTMVAAAYVADTIDSEWLLSDYETTRYVPLGTTWELQVQCCWLDLVACSSLTTPCDVYGDSYPCTCNPLMTFQLTGDTCPGETVNLCP